MNDTTTTTVGQVVDIDTGTLRVWQIDGQIKCQISVAVSRVDNVTEAQDNGWIWCPIVREFLECDDDPEDLWVVGSAWAAALGWEPVARDEPLPDDAGWVGGTVKRTLWTWGTTKG